VTASANASLGADLLGHAPDAYGFHVVSFNPGASEEIIASALERNDGNQPVWRVARRGALFSTRRSRLS
jgi:hypothetical protein